MGPSRGKSARQRPDTGLRAVWAVRAPRPTRGRIRGGPSVRAAGVGRSGAGRPRAGRGAVDQRRRAPAGDPRAGARAGDARPPDGRTDVPPRYRPPARPARAGPPIEPPTRGDGNRRPPPPESRRTLRGPHLRALEGTGLRRRIARRSDLGGPA